ncbi:MAG: SprT-like domain-containing protein [Gammaproteobacteria bacterium]
MYRADDLVTIYLRKAGNFDRDTRYPTSLEVKWSLRGRVAGRAPKYPWAPGNQYIKLNPYLALQEQEDFLQETVGHEVAHVIANCWIQQHGAHAERKYTRPHGIVWQRVMKFYGLESSVCHNYDTSKQPSALPYFPYRCACPDRTWKITIIRHERALAGIKYLCRYCKQHLIYAG